MYSKDIKKVVSRFNLLGNGLFEYFHCQQIPQVVNMIGFKLFFFISFHGIKEIHMYHFLV